MIQLLVMILICTVLSHKIQLSPELALEYNRATKPYSEVTLFGITIYLILFAGLRTKYNDTYTYIESFVYFASSASSDRIIHYGGFKLYQYLIHKYISTNPQVFLFISAVIITSLYVNFISKYSDHFGESMFLFLTGAYIASMAGIKQSMATAIALYAIPEFFHNKYIRAAVILILAMSIHPYVICMGCIVMLGDSCWNKKTITVAMIFVLLFINVERIFGLLEVIGKDYSDEYSIIVNSYTINPIRVIVDAIPVILSFWYRDRINQADDRWMITGVNFQLIGFIFVALGLFYNPIYLGRMNLYFTMISMISIPKMLDAIWNNTNYKIFYYAFALAYFFADITKLGTIPFTYDQFQQTSIMSLF